MLPMIQYGFGKVARAAAPLLAGVVLLAATGGAGAQSQTSAELQAAFVYNFIKLVTWPVGQFADERTPLRVCLIDGDPSEASFTDSMTGKSVGGRSIEVRALPPEDANNCQVLFLGSGLERRYAELMARLSRRGLLIVDEGKSFSWPHGMIRLFVGDGRMRFEINLEAIEGAGFSVDPRMIRLARIAVH